MAVEFKEGNKGYIKNLEVLGYSKMDGNCGMFQMALYKTKEGKYLQIGRASCRERV